MKLDRQIWLEHGAPMIFGAEKNKGLVLNGLELEVVTIGQNGITESDLLVHDSQNIDTTLHNLLVNMMAPDFPVAFGVIREVEGTSFDENVWKQIKEEKANSKFNSVDELMTSGVTWEIE